VSSQFNKNNDDGSDDVGQQVEQIQWRLNEWCKDLSLAQHKKFQVYHGELLKFYKKINLISPKSIFNADAVHFADCIFACKIIRSAYPKMNELYDLGSGNGFPGMVYAILYPETKVILMDSDLKRCDFMKHVASNAEVKNIEVRCQTIESVADASIGFAISRSFLSLSKALYTTRKMIKSEGVYFHLKGDEWGLEITDLPSQICAIWNPALLGQYKVPTLQNPLFVLKTTKIG